MVIMGRKQSESDWFRTDMAREGEKDLNIGLGIDYN